jgi:hypothetical protein
MERRQRQRRAFITIGVLLLGLFFAFWYGLSYYEADRRGAQAATPAPTCRPYDPEVILPADIEVNVYNSTNRNGLAGRSAALLEQRGFAVGKVANDPSDRDTPKVAEVRYGVEGRPKALVVLEVMPEGTRAVKDKRDDGSVDVALGTDFKGLAPATSSTEPPMCPAPTES